MFAFRDLFFPAVVWLVAGIVWSGPAAGQRPQPVDLELAFVVDASGSIDDEETRLQRKGYADAVANRRVLQAIGSGFLRSISVAYIEFAGEGCTRLSVPWTRITGRASAVAFGTAILANDRILCPGGNAIGEAVAFAAESIGSNKFDGTRRVIDVSGDGPNTFDPPIEAVRDAAVKSGIVINALAIFRPSYPDLPEYYRESVTGGPGSFVIKAESRKTFAQAILRKLVREIAARQPSGTGKTVEQGRVVDQNLLSGRLIAGPHHELVEQVAVVRHDALPQNGVGPVAAPDDPVGARRDQRFGKRAHVVIGRPLVGQAVPARDLRPAMSGVAEQIEQRLETGMTGSLAAAYAAEMVDHEIDRQAAQSGFQFGDLPGLVDVQDDMPAEMFDPVRHPFQMFGADTALQHGRKADPPDTAPVEGF